MPNEPKFAAQIGWKFIAKMGGDFHSTACIFHALDKDFKPCYGGTRMGFRGTRSRVNRAFQGSINHLASRVKRTNRDSALVLESQLYKNRQVLSRHCYKRLNDTGVSFPDPTEVFVGTSEQAAQLAAMDEAIGKSHFVSAKERSQITRELFRLERRLIKRKNSRIVATHADEIAELLLCEPPEPAFSGLRAKPRLRLRSLSPPSMPLSARPSIQPNAPTF